MTEKIESFSSRKLAESNGTVMTTQNILREARMLKNVIKDPKQQQQSDVKEEDDLKEEKEEREMEEKEEQHRSFSRTGNDLIETDDELVEVSVYLIVLITITIYLIIVMDTITYCHQNGRKINAIQHHRSFTTKLFL